MGEWEICDVAEFVSCDKHIFGNIQTFKLWKRFGKYIDEDKTVVGRWK